jgi:hypothetical protein
MSKVAPDATIDGGLTYIDGSDGLFVCSTEPTTYAQASTDYMLATQVLASSDITIADDASGRPAYCVRYSSRNNIALYHLLHKSSIGSWWNGRYSFLESKYTRSNLRLTNGNLISTGSANCGSR